MKSLTEWKDHNPLELWVNSHGPKHGAKKRVQDELRVSRQAYYKWVHGKTNPTRKHFERMEQLYGITWELWRAWLARKPSTKARVSKGSRAAKVAGAAGPA